MLELSGLFVCLGGLVHFQFLGGGGEKKLLVCGLRDGGSAPRLTLWIYILNWTCYSINR